MLLVAPPAAQAVHDPSLEAFYEQRCGELSKSWSDAKHYYVIPGNYAPTRLNARMLELHALSALHDERGACRHDDRGRRIAAALVRAPAYVAGSTPILTNVGQPHKPGWSANLESSLSVQHVSLDGAVAVALRAAHRARRRLGLPARDAALITDRLRAVADSRFFAYPAIAQNQFNWNADVYAAATAVGGGRRFLREDYRMQLMRFVHRMHRSGGRGTSSYLNDGDGLHYLPTRPASEEHNSSDTAEYANLVLSGLAYYDEALRAGMKRLPSSHVRALRRWGQRVLYGNWTHAGYLNWDSGLGNHRWHLSRYWGFALDGPTAFDGAKRILPVADRSYASAILRQALVLYDRFAATSPDGFLPSLPFGLKGPTEYRTDALLTAGRFATAAFRLHDHDIPAGKLPPSMFAHDPDIRRVAVSTPAYNTGMQQAQRTQDYGGLEPARLYGALQQPLTGIDSHGRGALGLELRDSRGRLQLDTQPGDTRGVGRHGRLRVRSGGERLSRGRFRRLDVMGRMRAGRRSVRVAHTFRPASITTTHRVEAPKGTAIVLRFPGWRTRSISLVRGGVARDAHTGIALARGDVLRIVVPDGGYDVLLGRLPSGARLRMIAPAPRPGNPKPGLAALIDMRMSGSRAVMLTKITPSTAG